MKDSRDTAPEETPWFIPQRLRRNILPWLCAVAFVANFLCADGVLDVAQPLLGSASQESARQLADGASQDVHERLTFGLASAQAASTGAKERGQVIDFFRMAMGGVAGLVLFIYGVTRLAESLEELSTERMRKFLSTATTNRVAGVFTGIVPTTLLESSSVTIIMVIAMVSSGADLCPISWGRIGLKHRYRRRGADYFARHQALRGDSHERRGARVSLGQNKDAEESWARRLGFWLDVLWA